jgi:hypothetical protein
MVVVSDGGERTASASALVATTADSVPKVSVTVTSQLYGDNNKHKVTNKLRIESQASSSAVDPKWEVTWTCPSDNFEMVPANFATSLTSKTLVFKRDVLSPGVVYSFMAEYANGNLLDAKKGRATITVTTNAPPGSGRCFSNPTSGRLLETDFEFKCIGWTDDESPLKYKFSVVKDDGGMVELGVFQVGCWWVSGGFQVGFRWVAGRVLLSLLVRSSSFAHSDHALLCRNHALLTHYTSCSAATMPCSRTTQRRALPQPCPAHVLHIALPQPCPAHALHSDVPCLYLNARTTHRALFTFEQTNHTCFHCSARRVRTRSCQRHCLSDLRRPIIHTPSAPPSWTPSEVKPLPTSKCRSCLCQRI